MSKFLIVGLGNIGDEYENTRHNIGFTILDALAKEKNLKFTVDRLASITEYKFKGKTLTLVKPSTYMNLSGKAVNYWLQAEKIPKENLLVITDDLALPFGAVRMKGKGSDGGHNGLKNIQETLTTSEYARLRFGVGNEFSKGKQVDYVLGKWSDEDEKQLPERLNKAQEIIKNFAAIGLQLTMTNFNKDVEVKDGLLIFYYSVYKPLYIVIESLRIDYSSYSNSLILKGIIFDSHENLNSFSVKFEFIGRSQIFLFLLVDEYKRYCFRSKNFRTFLHVVVR
jgi:PTH1 family peptidyl-tRNA hydrolase